MLRLSDFIIIPFDNIIEMFHITISPHVRECCISKYDIEEYYNKEVDNISCHKTYIDQITLIIMQLRKHPQLVIDPHNESEKIGEISEDYR